ncbi:glycoside hydrolase family protein [Vibrio harveyi]|uniref:glycoside hydrolase family protein n=1 Tax=Vibrio harveyi TaxID=669 RepID=UPI0023808DD8|nr:glycoside hydrolase family protein [Vibrio harveyi]
MNALELYFKLLEFEEGFKSKPYYCTEGYPTVGIGWRIGPKGAPLELYEIELDIEQARVILARKVQKQLKKLERHDWFNKQNESRKAVIVSMAFQMGIRGLFGFKNMITALSNNNYRKASLEAIDSRWYRQTPNRAARHASVLEHGDIYLAYGELIK